MTNDQQKELNILLNEVGKMLDVTKTEYEQITSSYQAVGKFLAESPSPLSEYNPQIRPQGSFLLGTAVRPVSEDGDLDIDLVCELTQKPLSWTQYTTKNVVGDRLKNSELYRSKLDKEGKRCWTLIYADGKYHMDILPCFVNKEYTNAVEQMLLSTDGNISDTTAIRITDKNHSGYYSDSNVDHWIKSNPFGLANWFYRIAYRPSSLSKSIVLSEAIAPIPKYYETKSTLQRVIQLLKRHRDVCFVDDADDKPISMIITVLAARAYNDSLDIFDALKHIAFNMSSYVGGVPGHRVVSNPVAPEENFAEKWTINNKKEENFYKWLHTLQTDIDKLISSTGKGQDILKATFSELFGENISKRTFKAYGDLMLKERKAGKLFASASAATLSGSAGAKVLNHNFFGIDE